MGDSALAKEKILSIFSHITNVHSFPHHKKYKKCAHEEKEEAKPYLKEGSIAMAKVKSCILGRNGQNLDDVDHMDAYLHTGMLENVNSLLALKYAKKCHSYTWLGMWIRSIMAALDHNCSLQDLTQVGVV